jgi:hypothetical protein
MVRRYGSFLVRCWRLDADERRIEIEHVQSGGRTRVATLAAALDWIAAASEDRTTERPTEPARSHPETREVSAEA